MKRCRKCGVEKPQTDFYTHRQMADGHLNICKACVRTRVRRHRAVNSTVRLYDRNRPNKLERQRTAIESNRRRRRMNPEQYIAQTAVGNAIRDGRLQRQPCEVCGEKQAHAHHDDYSKPLEVRWLCALHHHRHHASIKTPL